MSDFGTGRQVNRPLLKRGGLVLGRFEWDARRAGMRRDSQIGWWPLIAIPLTAVRITQAGHAPVIADSCTAIFYSAHQSYRAEQLLDDQPEQTVYLVPDEQTLAACFPTMDEPGKPMPMDHGPIAPRLFAELRQLVAALERETGDLIAVHESATELAGELIQHALAARGATRPLLSRGAGTSTRHRDIAQAVREYCLNHFAEPIDL